MDNTKKAITKASKIKKLIKSDRSENKVINNKQNPNKRNIKLVIAKLFRI